jgi:hypothetical protein
MWEEQCLLIHNRNTDGMLISVYKMLQKQDLKQINQNARPLRLSMGTDAVKCNKLSEIRPQQG